MPKPKQKNTPALQSSREYDSPVEEDSSSVAGCSIHSSSGSSFCQLPTAQYEELVRPLEGTLCETQIEEKRKAITLARLRDNNISWSHLLEQWQAHLQPFAYFQNIPSCLKILRFAWLRAHPETAEEACCLLREHGPRIFDKDLASKLSEWKRTVLQNMRPEKYALWLSEESKHKYISPVLRSGGYVSEEVEMIFKCIACEREVPDCTEVDQKLRFIEQYTELLHKRMNLFKHSQKLLLESQDHVIGVAKNSLLDAWAYRDFEDIDRPDIIRKLVSDEKIKFLAASKRRVIKDITGNRDVVPPKLFDLPTDEKIAVKSLLPQLKQYVKKKQRLREFYMKTKPAACFDEVLRHWSGQDTTLLPANHSHKNILVIGYIETSAQSETPDHPVVVRSVGIERFPRAAAGEDAGNLPQSFGWQSNENLMLLEFGARLDGFYCELDSIRCDRERQILASSALTIHDTDYIQFVEFVPGSAPRQPRAKRLERILSEPIDSEAGTGRFTHILFILPPSNRTQSTAYRDIMVCGTRFLVSLESPGQVVTEGVPQDVLTVAPRTSFAAEQGHLAFRRFCLLLPSTLSAVQEERPIFQHFLRPRKREEGLLESAEVLAQAIALIMHAITLKDVNFDEKEQLDMLCKSLQERPLLLYCLNVQSLFQMNQPLVEKAIGVVWRSLVFPPSSLEDEDTARKIVIELVLGTSGRPPHVAALVSPTSWKMLKDVVLPTLLIEHFHHIVEASNFQTTMTILQDHAERAYLTFFFIEFTGRLSLTQLEQLIRIGVDYPSVKFIFPCFSGLRSLVSQVSPTTFLTIYSDPGLEDVDRARSVSHSRGCPLGLIALQSMQHFLNDTEALHRLLVRCQRDSYNHGFSMKQLHNWIRESDEGTKFTIEAAIRIVVSMDPAAFVDSLEVPSKKIANDPEAELQITAISASEGDCYNRLNQFFCPRVEMSGPVIRLLVLKYAHLIDSSQLSTIARKCIAARVFAIFVVECATTNVSRLHSVGRAGASVDLAVLQHQHRHVWRDLSPLEQGFSLIWGRDSLVHASTRDVLTKITNNETVDAATLTCLPCFDHSDTVSFTRDDLLLVFKILSSSDPPRSSSNSSLLEVLCLHVRGVLQAPRDRDYCPPSFAEFVLNPMCLFLAQSQRLDLYLFELWYHTAESSRSGPDFPCGVPILRNFDASARQNLDISCYANPGPILLARRSPRPVSSPKFVASYIHPGSGDSVNSFSTLIESCALKPCDAPWKEVYESWGTSTGVPESVLLHILRYSPMHAPSVYTRTE